MTTIKTTWVDGLRFVNRTGSGHDFVTDAPGPDGAPPAAPTPMELVLAGLTACSGVDVAAILTKMRLPVRSLEITAEAERAEEHPRIYTRIRLKYQVTGDVPEKKLRKAIDLSAKTYCSVGAMLGKSAEISHDFEILPDDVTGPRQP